MEPYGTMILLALVVSGASAGSSARPIELLHMLLYSLSR